jgi:hypothetical protein
MEEQGRMSDFEMEYYYREEEAKIGDYIIASYEEYDGLIGVCTSSWYQCHLADESGTDEFMIDIEYDDGFVSVTENEVLYDSPSREKVEHYLSRYYIRD